MEMECYVSSNIEEKAVKGTDENFWGEGNVCYLDCGHAQIKAFTKRYHTEHFTCMWSTVHQFYLRKVKEREWEEIRAARKGNPFEEILEK